MTSAQRAAYAHLPLSFERNDGQVDRRVAFLSHGPGYTLFLTGAEAVLSLVRQSPLPLVQGQRLRPLFRPQGVQGRYADRPPSPITSAHGVPVQEIVVRLHLVGASAHPSIVGLDKLPGRVNYFIGNKRRTWHTNIATYARVAYRNVYPGVDLVYYGNHEQLEYDWVVAPGANPRTIRLTLQGPRGLRLDRNGTLVLATDTGALLQSRPLVYQQVSTQTRRLIAAHYTLQRGTIGIAVGAYDRRKSLVVDPVLSYSTYLGGTTNGGQAVGVAVDSAGNAYVTGNTAASDFPITNAVQATSGGAVDVFVSKLSAAGTSLVYSTYLGGSRNDDGYAIAVDSTGSAYITGMTASSNFPTVNAFQSTAASGTHAFVSKLSAAGNALVYSTYLAGTTYPGGYNFDQALGIAVDGTGNAYVTGRTLSTNFPTANAFQGTKGGGSLNTAAFVAKLNASGNTLLYGTYLGGTTYLNANADDIGYGITADNAGNAYVTGIASSTNFPTVNALQATLGGAGTSPNAFVTKVNTTASGGASIVYSTYLGGNSTDRGLGMAVDSAGNAYVTGSAASTDFPTVHPLQSTMNGVEDAFVAKLNPAGSALLYSTYLGGSADDTGNGIAVDRTGDAYIAGTTSSANFPTANALQNNLAGSGNAFVAKLNPAGSALLYSTYLGGSGSDDGFAIAVDGAGSAYVTGDTGSTNFPTQNAFQTTCSPCSNTFSDGFVAKLTAAGSGDVPWHPHQTVGGIGSGIDLAVDLADGHVDVRTNDLSLPGRGPDLTLARTWDSTLAQASGGATAMQGWTASLTPHMSGLMTGTVTYADGSGALWPFSYTGLVTATAPYTQYTTPPGQPWQLVTSATAGYTLTDILTSETWTFDTRGRLTADSDAYGNKNSLNYGAGSSTSPSSESNSGGRALVLAYSTGQLSEAQSPLWQSGGSGAAGSQHVTYGYNGSSQLTTRTQGAGTTDAVTTTFGYSGTQLITITTPAQRSWTLGYDGQGRVTTITSPVSGTLGQPGYTPAYSTTVAYNAGAGTNQSVVVAGAGTSAALTTTYTLDSQGEATAVTDGLGHSTATRYDTDHDVLSSTDANGNTTTNAYQYVGPTGSSGAGSLGVVGLLTQTVAPPIQAYGFSAGLSPVVTTHRYDPGTYDLLETDLPEGGVQRYGYDGRHSVITSAESLDSAGTRWRGTMTGYDQYGEPASATDGRGVSVSSGGVVTLADPQGLYTSHSAYDAQGDMVSRSTPAITTTLNGYTATLPVTTTYGYDGDGHQTAQVSPTHYATTTRYDHLGRAVQTVQPAVALWTAPLATTPVAALNSGGSAAGAFSADGSYSGGNPYSTGAAIDTSGVASPAPQAVYQTERNGDFNYTIGGLTAGASYRVRLHFAEIFWSLPGQRVFNVAINGQPVLTNFDIVAAAGGPNKAIVEEAPATASSSGQLTISYTTVVDRAKSSGIEVFAATTPTQTTGYDADGRVVRAVDANGSATSSSYDPWGRLISETNPVSGTTLMTYTATELTTEQDPQGNISTTQYDAAGRLITATAPVSGTTQYQYDAVGNTTAITTADTTTGAPIQVETRQYDAQNRVITDTVSGPGGPSLTTATRYDHDGNVVQTQQPTGDVVYDSYDLAGQLLGEEIDAAPVSGPGSPGAVTYTTNRYDAAGNVVQSVDADGRTSTTSYDGDNRALQTIDVTTAPTGTTTITTTAGFDPNGNTLWQTTQTSDTTAPGVVQTHTYTATYNAADWLMSSTDDGLVTTYGYDAAGQVRTHSVVDGVTPVTLLLDAAGRATALGESVGGSGPYTSTFTYNADDRVTALTQPGGIQETAQYDPNGNLTALQALGPTGVLTPLNSLYRYGYTAADWITSIITTVNGVGGTEVITHDAQGRVVADQRPGASGLETWSYDGNGNLLTNVEEGATTVYTYTASLPNELLQQHTDGHGVEYFGYDQHGNTTSITSTDSQTQPLTSTYVISDALSYDAQSRPITLTLKDATVTMGYNAQGQRNSYTVTPRGQSQPSLTMQFQYRDDVLGQVVVSGTQRYTDTYLYTPGGAPLELLRQQGGTTTRYWYVLDGRDNVVALTDATGAVVDRYSYDLWGEPESVSETVPQQLRYRGYWYDAKLGWYWLAVRSYDPEGRWLQPDPSELDGVRTYVYVGDAPSDRSDPTGHQECLEGIGFTATPDGCIEGGEGGGDIGGSGGIGGGGGGGGEPPPGEGEGSKGGQQPTQASVPAPVDPELGHETTTSPNLRLLDAPKTVGSYGQLIRRGLQQAHHIIQDAAVRGIRGYSYSRAPAINLRGSFQEPGTPHYRATLYQTRAGGRGTYGAERIIAYRSLRAAGLTKAQARAAVQYADQYFRRLGVTEQTRTRIPGRRAD